MAVAEKVGFDRRGNTLYKRSPDGEEILEDVEEVERSAPTATSSSAACAARRRS
jgi:hypothetical protein